MAFVSLSLFVYIPKIYHEQYGLSLVSIVSVFLITAVISLALTPLLGALADRLNLKRIYRKKVIYVCLPFMALSFYFLAFPPFHSLIAIIFFYTVTFLLHNIIFINHYAMSVEITRDYRDQNRVAGAREMFILLGFLTATVFPTILADKYTFKEAYNELIFVFIALLFTAGTLLHFVKAKPSFMFHPELTLKKLCDIALSHRQGRYLIVLMLNGISQGLIITTVLFYVKYVINAEHLAGYMLLVYYISAIVSVPFWAKYSSKTGKKNTWVVSMIFASLFFAASLLLGEGDIFEFMVICVATGICFGADILLAPSLFSDNVEKPEKAGSYYSLWFLASKFSLSVCVLVSFIMLGFYGFEARSMISAEEYSNSAEALSVIYCMVPCLFKLSAALVLLRAKIDIKYSR